MSNIVFAALAEAARRRESVALGIISGVKGSSPQKVGAKALFYPDGRIRGTLGGGCLEAEIQQRALDSLRTGQGSNYELLLDHDFGWDDGLICGGLVRGVIVPNAQDAGEAFWDAIAARGSTLTWGVRRDWTVGRPAEAGAATGTAGAGDWVYAETVRPPWAVWIAGAGHVAQAVAALALPLDFAITVFDDRPALACPQFFPGTVNLRADVWEKLLAEPLPAVPCMGLIMMRGHRHDALVLEQWIRKPFQFLGMIGSARKARTLFDHFLAEKLATAEQLARVACPVGVKIRCRTVPEIAVSILAQLIDKRAELQGA